MLYIKFRRNGFGTYVIKFENHNEAAEWLKVNEVELEAIDYIG